MLQNQRGLTALQKPARQPARRQSIAEPPGQYAEYPHPKSDTIQAEAPASARNPPQYTPTRHESQRQDPKTADPHEYATPRTATASSQDPPPRAGMRRPPPPGHNPAGYSCRQTGTPSARGSVGEKRLRQQRPRRTKNHPQREAQNRASYPPALSTRKGRQNVHTIGIL